MDVDEKSVEIDKESVKIENRAYPASERFLIQVQTLISMMRMEEK